MKVLAVLGLLTLVVNGVIGCDLTELLACSTRFNGPLMTAQKAGDMTTACKHAADLGDCIKGTMNEDHCPMSKLLPMRQLFDACNIDTSWMPKQNPLLRNPNSGPDRIKGPPAKPGWGETGNKNPRGNPEVGRCDTNTIHNCNKQLAEENKKLATSLSQGQHEGYRDAVCKSAANYIECVKPYYSACPTHITSLEVAMKQYNSGTLNCNINPRDAISANMPHKPGPNPINDIPRGDIASSGAMWLKQLFEEKNTFDFGMDHCDMMSMKKCMMPMFYEKPFLGNMGMPHSEPDPREKCRMTDNMLRCAKPMIAKCPEMVPMVKMALNPYAGAPYHCSVSLGAMDATSNCDYTTIKRCMGDMMQAKTRMTTVRYATQQQEIKDKCQIGKNFAKCAGEAVQQCQHFVPMMKMGVKKLNEEPYKCGIMIGGMMPDNTPMSMILMKSLMSGQMKLDPLAMGHCDISPLQTCGKMLKDKGPMNYGTNPSPAAINEKCRDCDAFLKCINPTLKKCRELVPLFKMVMQPYLKAPFNCPVSFGDIDTPEHCDYTTLNRCFENMMGQKKTLMKLQYTDKPKYMEGKCRMGKSLVACTMRSMQSCPHFVPLMMTGIKPFNDDPYKCNIMMEGLMQPEDMNMGAMWMRDMAMKPKWGKKDCKPRPPPPGGRPEMGPDGKPEHGPDGKPRRPPPGGRPDMGQRGKPDFGPDGKPKHPPPGGRPDMGPGGKPDFGSAGKPRPPSSGEKYMGPGGKPEFGQDGKPRPPPPDCEPDMGPGGKPEGGPGKKPPKMGHCDFSGMRNCVLEMMKGKSTLPYNKKSPEYLNQKCRLNTNLVSCGKPILDKCPEIVPLVKMAMHPYTEAPYNCDISFGLADTTVHCDYENIRKCHDTMTSNMMVLMKTKQPDSDGFRSEKCGHAETFAKCIKDTVNECPQLAPAMRMGMKKINNMPYNCNITFEDKPKPKDEWDNTAMCTRKMQVCSNGLNMSMKKSKAKEGVKGDGRMNMVERCRSAHDYAKCVKPVMQWCEQHRDRLQDSVGRFNSPPYNCRIPVFGASTAISGSIVTLVSSLLVLVTGVFA